MTIADVAIRRPITVCMTFVGIILLGAFASQMLPLELFPQVEVPFVSLSIPYPNATPEEVEKNITRPVEEALATMSGIQEMKTTSRDGYAFVQLILDFKRDVAHKGVEAKERIENIRHLLPDDVTRVLLRQQGPDQIPMLNLVISTDMDLNQAYNLLEARLVRSLERVPGVNSVDLFGIDKRYVQISLRNDRLGAHNLDINTIRDRLARQNFIVSAGTITADGMRMRVHPIGIYESLQSIRDLPLDAPGLHLGDVAEVSWALRENRDRRRVNGQRAIGLSVHKEAEANLVSVYEGIERVLDKAKEDPVFEGTTFLPLNNLAEMVGQSIADVRNNGLIGGVLSLIVLFAFLRRMTSALLIAAAVPLSLCFTLVVMYFSGMSLNIISITGLMLAIGLLVDNSVVVTESIHLNRTRHPGHAFDATAKGVRDVGLAITAGTFTTVIVFLPIVFSEIRMVAIIQQNIAIPVTVSLMASLVVAQTLLPTLAARMNLEQSDAHGRLIESLRVHYLVVLRWILAHPPASLAMVAVALASVWYPVTHVNVDMNPEAEERQLQLRYSIRGYQELDVVDAMVDEVEQYLLANRERFEIENVFSHFDGGRGNTTINLRSEDEAELSSVEIKNLIKKGLPEFAIARITFDNFSRGAGGGGQRASIRITGEATDQLRGISEDIIARLERIPELKDVESDAESTQQELRVVVDQQKARTAGVSAQAVARSVSVAMRGIQMRRGFYTGDGEAEIWLELAEADRESLASLRNLPIYVPGGETIALEALADFEIVSASRSINRENRQTSVNINFGLNDIPMMQARSVVTNAMNEVELPSGYHWQFGRRFGDDNDMQREMTINMILAGILIYMLMAALFESALFPIAILCSIGYAAVGVYWFFYFTNTTMTSMALTGMLLLMGIVVNNGIVLLNRIQHLRREGIERLEAVLNASRDRLRPILMTVCTTVVAMLPLSLGDVRVGGIGPAYYPMARAIIGGLMFSTVVTLLLLPLLYVLLDELKRHGQSVLGQARATASE